MILYYKSLCRNIANPFVETLQIPLSKHCKSLIRNEDSDWLFSLGTVLDNYTGSTFKIMTLFESVDSAGKAFLKAFFDNQINRFQYA